MSLVGKPETFLLFFLVSETLGQEVLQDQLQQGMVYSSLSVPVSMQSRKGLGAKVVHETIYLIQTLITTRRGAALVIAIKKRPCKP